MLRNKLVRGDGSIIDSSVIISCEFTEEVNSSTNLTVGDVTSSELTVEIRSTEAIQQGEVLTYYMIEDGVETLIGIFIAEKPTVASRTSIKFSAYDNIVKTEKVFSEWLRENQSAFPMSLLSLVQRACEYCGVTLATTDFPMYNLSVGAFYADEITCRQVLSWAGAIAGRFVRANTAGGVEFAWYVAAQNKTMSPSKQSGEATNLEVYDDGEGNLYINSDKMTVTDDGDGHVIADIPDVMVLESEGNVSLVSASAIPYVSDGLSYETYTTDVIRRVQIKHSDDDVGVIYPADATGNCFALSGNMILGTCTTEDVTTVASRLYTQLSGISYVPANVRTFRTIRVRAGDIITVVGSNGTTITTYVMKVAVTSSGTTISSTGDKSYGENAAVASERFSNLTGKLLSIQKSVEGLEIKNQDLAGSFSSIKATTDSIESTVGGVKDDVNDVKDSVTEMSTTFSQTKEAFEMRFSTAEGDLDVLKTGAKEQAAYIRFIEGNIHLGKTDSSLTLVLKNNRVSFFNGSKEIAYVSENKLYITDGEFLANLYIGKFAFTPRDANSGTSAAGNLSFRKVIN